MNSKDFKKLLLEDKEFRRQYYSFDIALAISRQLVEARVKTGITQARLARLANTSQSAIARAESGAHIPSLEFLQKLAIAYGTYLILPRFAFMENTENKTSISQTFDAQKQPAVNLGELNYLISCRSYPPATLDFSRQGASL